MTLMERVKAWWWRQIRRGKILTIGPLWNQFPELGPDGQVTIDCVIGATSYQLPDYPVPDEQPDGVITGISPHCVGAMLVEVNQYGFRLRWKPIQKPETLFPPSFCRVPLTSPPTEAGQQKPKQVATDIGKGRPHA